MTERASDRAGGVAEARLPDRLRRILRAAADPWAALSRPACIVALIVLGVNDHVLKGAGLLPSEITGKLSDVSGLYVAPILLACLGGARTVRGVLAAAAIVGLGFAALQTTDGARLAEATTATLGVPWRVWPDPSDLLALPMLLAALVATRRLDPSTRPAKAPRVTARVAFATLAFLCCAGTSYQPPSYPRPPVGTLVDVHVHSLVAHTVMARVETLAPEIELDCDLAIRRPSEAIGAVGGRVFASSRPYGFEPRTNWPLWDRARGLADRPCYLVQFVVQGRAWWVAWRHGTPPARSRPWRSDTPGPEALRLMEIDGKLSLLGVRGVRVEPVRAIP